jgi:hypothetical protein
LLRHIPFEQCVRIRV